MFDAHTPETGLARDDDVGKLRGDVRAGSVTDDPQRFVSNHGYVAESVWVALVDHVGQQESDGRRNRGWTRKLLGACCGKSQKENQEATDPNFLREHTGW
jgi:hypothetical protein